MFVNILIIIILFLNMINYLQEIVNYKEYVIKENKQSVNTNKNLKTSTIEEYIEYEHLISPDMPKNQLIEASPDKCFILHNGGSLKSITELKEALRTMDDTTFKYHVNDQRNDFANWIRDVFSNQELANSLKNIKSTKDAYNIL